MKSLFKTLLRELAQLIKSESGGFQTYDRKVELLNSDASSSADRHDGEASKRVRSQSGAPADLYFQSSLGHRRAPFDPGIARGASRQ
jgi:hypothetical protein